MVIAPLMNRIMPRKTYFVEGLADFDEHLKSCCKVKKFGCKAKYIWLDAYGGLGVAGQSPL